MNLLKNLETAVDKISNIFAAAAGALLLLISLAITVNALARYFFNLTSSLLLEFTEYSLLWMTFLGVGWLARKDGHICIDLITNIVNPKLKKWLAIIALCIGTLIFLVIACYSAYVTYSDFRANLLLQTVFEPPKWIIEIIIPIGSFFLFLQLLFKLLGNAMHASCKRSAINPGGN